jgi:NAD(P)-dependent dehydrogenase (short-subunit alcohol dehydrogenase family)
MEGRKMSLNDRVVVVTGATGGLGKVVSHHASKAGSRLVLVGTNPEKLAILKRDLELSEDQVLCFAADLTQSEAAIKLSQAVLDKFGRVDVLLHFVGGWIGGKPLAQVTKEDISTMLDQHVLSTFHLLQALVPGLVTNGWGRIIVVSSPVVANPPANNAPYTIAKTGEEALILTIAEELKHSGVTANIIRVRTIDVKHERNSSPTPKNVAWTTPEEIWLAIEYLCSDEAGVVNGAKLPLYGSP